MRVRREGRQDRLGAVSHVAKRCRPHAKLAPGWEPATNSTPWSCGYPRRLCSEGSRPRLPWAQRIPAFVENPAPVLPILEALKDDPDLYARRSVANHLGDIAKGRPELAFEICERWLKEASAERKWLIRHAVRHPAKSGVKAALRLRKTAR